MEEIKVFDSSSAVNVSGTSLAGYLNNVTYQELINALGRPTSDEPSGDGKVQVEWVLEFRGNVYTIYDWKTFDREYTENELTRWNIGSKVNAFDFIDAMEVVIRESREGI